MNRTSPPGTRRRRRLAAAVLMPLLVVTAIAVFAGQDSPRGERQDMPALDAQTLAVTKLDPDLLVALRRAAADASKKGVEFRINSGWRSPAEQERLLRKAIAKYGSREEAARWVATPETSAHVAGEAVDIAPYAAIDWLSRYGARYGLCQIYANESWHFELRPEAARKGCPRMYPDPTHDPRMQPRRGAKKR